MLAKNPSKQLPIMKKKIPLKKIKKNHYKTKFNTKKFLLKIHKNHKKIVAKNFR